MFSAKLAWHRPLLRYVALGTLILVVAGSAAFFWRVIPARRAAGTMVIHYNIYLGIDEVRGWGWVFLLPSVWLLLTLVDLWWAFGAYHHDPHLAASLVSLALLSALPCAGALYYLARMNL